MSDRPPPPVFSPDSSETFLVGFIIANIVGLRYYHGTISGREMVALVREPLNSNDPNAIKVLNTGTIQVGYIERSVAAILAPLVDAGVAVVEGIVPKPPQVRSPFRIPCQVHIFAPFDFIDDVSRAVSFAGLHLYSPADHGFGLSESVIVKEANSGSTRNIDEIFRSVETDTDKAGKKLVIVEPPKDIISSDLFLHQKEALGWLVHRENSCELPPFWEERNGLYTNVLTNYQTEERPEPLRGGILADDMGLGKTLTMISLIATNRPGHFLDEIIENCEEDVGDVSVTVGKRCRAAKSTKRIAGTRKKKKLSDGSKKNESSSVLAPKTTLIVCPLSVISTWTTQIEEHSRRGSLKVYLYYGERTKDPAELRRYDIVLTTYSTLGSELGYASPINEVEWLRVILDEAHVIKNAAAKQSEAVIGLKAERRWVVTGTPIQNGSSDLFSLMSFLRFQPFSIKSYWQSLVQRPLERGQEFGLSRLQALMGTISLRRTKDNKNLVGLPHKIVQTCFVDLSPHEREQYDRMETEAKSAVKEFINNNSVMRNYSSILHIILRLRQICNDVVLCPSDIKSLLAVNTLQDVSNNPELLMKLLCILQDGDDFDCPICLSPPKETVITCCTHVFCHTCILKVLKALNPRCPMCRHPLATSDIFKAPPKLADDNNTMISSDSTSSKVSALLNLLNASREKHPQIKSVVFSQFRKMLLLLEEPLKAAGFGVLRLDGTMNAKERARVIKEFGEQGEGSPNVLLASLKAAGTGINLTAASRLYLVEPWWNPAVEEQAMDRVHRIGQKEEVIVVRLIVRDSIEERILGLQEKKKNLARGAFERKGSKEQKQVRVEDLRAMMQL